MSINKKFLYLLPFLLIIPLIIGDIYLSDDKYFHLLRIENLASSLKNLDLFPKVYGDMLYGYGYALPLFYPQLFIYIPAIFTLFGISLDNSYNLFLIIINIGTLIISYKCSKEFFGDKTKAYIFAILYLIMPYRLVLIYNRNALGELLSLMFLPLLFLFIYKFCLKDVFSKPLLISSFTLVLNSHLISAYLFFIILLIVFIVYFKKIFNKNHIKDLIKSIFLVILLNSYFLIPLIEQLLSQNFLFSKNLLGTLQDNTFKILNINSLFLKSMLFISIIIGVLFLLKKIKFNLYLYYLLFIIVFILLITTNIFPWEIVKIPLINKIQFPFRFFILLNILLPLLIIEVYDIIIKSYYFKQLNLKHIYIVSISILLTFITVFFISGVLLGKRVDDNVVFNNAFLVGGEYLPYNYTNKYILDNIYEVKGVPELKLLKNNNSYILKLNRPISKGVIELPLIYYKGYSIKSSNKFNINLNQSNHGLIELNIISPIDSEIEIVYSGTYTQKISFLISVVVLLLI